MVEVIPVKFLKAIEGRKGLYEIRIDNAATSETRAEQWIRNTLNRWI